MTRATRALSIFDFASLSQYKLVAGAALPTAFCVHTKPTREGNAVVEGWVQANPGFTPLPAPIMHRERRVLRGRYIRAAEAAELCFGNARGHERWLAA